MATTTDVRVLGIGMTRQGRLGEPVDELARAAARAALDDAGLQPAEVGRVLVANAMGGLLGEQEMIRGQVWLRSCGFGLAPVTNVENACASGAAAIELARLAVLAGESPVLVVGAEKMWVGDRDRTIASLEHGLAADERLMLRSTHGGSDTVLMGINAAWAQRQIEQMGATREQFAAVAAKAYRHGSLNPLAQHRTPHTVGEILASRSVAGALTRLMCSSFTDGAAAAVLGSRGRGSRAPVVRAHVAVGGDGTMPYHDRLRLAADTAWKAADIEPGDVDAVELHDVTSAEELWALESLGLYELGEAGPATLAGHTALGGGGVVVNPSGGLVARGHPVGATGICQVAEIATQLRGQAGGRQVEGIRLAAAANTGGVFHGATTGGVFHGDAATIAITVLSRA